MAFGTDAIFLAVGIRKRGTLSDVNENHNLMGSSSVKFCPEHVSVRTNEWG